MLQVRLFPHDGNRDNPLDPATPLGAMRINVQANAHDRISGGSQNAGLYRIGYQLFNVQTGQIVPGFDRFPTQQYDSLSAADNVRIAYDSFFSHGGFFGNVDYSFFYFANNTKGGGTAEMPIDTATLPDGQYRICVIAEDIRGNRSIVDPTGASCTTFKIDRTPPTAKQVLVERRPCALRQGGLLASPK